MSSLASWSYTAKATHWPLIAVNDWSRVATFGPPSVFDCDYKAEAKRMTNAKGVEFTSSQVIYTERADIKPGDRVLIGDHAGDPIAAGAWEVRAVKRDADTFNRAADDMQVIT